MNTIDPTTATASELIQNWEEEKRIKAMKDEAQGNGSDGPLNAAMLLLYELSIANAPFPSADCRDVADKIGARIGEARALLEKYQRRILAFQEGYKDKGFEVTALEIQLMDLRAHGVDKVTARNNEKLRAKLHAVSIERNELRAKCSALYEAAKDAISIMSDDAPYYRHNGVIEKLRAALSLVEEKQ